MSVLIFFFFLASELDISGTSFIIQLAAGAEGGCVQIPTVDDALPEGEEVLVINAEPIGQDTTRVLLSVGSATVTIEDNDGGGKGSSHLQL